MLTLTSQQCCNKADIKLYTSRIKNLPNPGMARSKTCIKVFINVWTSIPNADSKMSTGRNMNSRRWGSVSTTRAQEWTVALFVDSSPNSTPRTNSTTVQGSRIFSPWMICLTRAESECHVGKKLGISKVTFWFVYSTF